MSEISLLKGLVGVFVIDRRELETHYHSQREMIYELANLLYESADKNLQTVFKLDWQLSESDSQRKRVIVDQIASLTDRSVFRWHRNLTGRSLSKIFV